VIVSLLTSNIYLYIYIYIHTLNPFVHRYPLAVATACPGECLSAEPCEARRVRGLVASPLAQTVGKLSCINWCIVAAQAVDQEFRWLGPRHVCRILLGLAVYVAKRINGREIVREKHQRTRNCVPQEDASSCDARRPCLCVPQVVL